jgi:uncharacterized membrane protein
MIGFDSPIFLLLLIPAVAASVLFWRNGFVNLSRNRARVALGIRLVLLALIVLGLAGMSLDLGQSRQAAVIVADLSSSDSRDSTQMQQFINKVALTRSGADRLGVVTFGREATVEQPVSPMSVFGSFQTQSQLQPDYSNLAGGLLLGNAILPPGYEHRVTLLTDGQQNVGDAVSAAQLLHTLHVRVDVMPTHVTTGPDVLVDSVTMPSQLRPDEQFILTVAIHSTIATSVPITIYRDQTLVVSTTRNVAPGETRFSFKQKPLHPGFHTFTVRINPVRDTISQNNTGSAFAVVTGKPKVLVISPSPAPAANVLASLRTTGINSTLETPAQLIPSLGFLERFAGVVIVDTPVEDFNPHLVDDLVPYVRDLGRGLLVIGGTESYGMGGYGQTGLEKALPVAMNLPKRRDLPTAAVVLIIESLESNSQVNISKVAGKGVVSLMTQQDWIAVNDANGGQFPVPLQHVTNKSAIDGRINSMIPGDPMSYAPDLRDAANVLKGVRATVKHIILLGDGDAFDPSYQRVLTSIRAQGITVSSVATNGMGYSDISTMQNIARWGGGRFYNANNPNAIPQIFLREARTFARSGIITGKFYPQILSSNPMLKDLHSMPYLTGYVATTPKPTGEMVLVSKKLDPVLAAWQFGLGRSVAWTSDASGLWTKDWLAAPGGNRFWSDLVAWTLPSASQGKLSVVAGSSQGEGTLSVTVPSTVGPTPSVTARILGPSLKTSTVQLQPVSPGLFQGSFPASAQGAYFVSAEASGASHAEIGEAGVDIPYSAEYRTSGTNMSLIRAIARAGGGSVVRSPSSVWAGNLAPASARQSLSLWLWLLALLLLPIDVGVRRLIVGRRDLEAILRAIPGFQRPQHALTPAVATLGTIRQQRSGGGETLNRLRRRAARQSAPAAPDRRNSVGAGSPGSRVRIEPEARKAAAKSAPPVKAPPEKTPGPASTTGQLLSSKRKRKD